jgi:choline kinase
MEQFSISILEYLGKVENGVLVLISIVHNQAYHEATFFYTEGDMILTIGEDLESKIGEITGHPQYPEILREILKKIVPYKDIYDGLDSVDFNKWVDGLVELNIIDREELKRGNK